MSNYSKFHTGFGGDTAVQFSLTSKQEQTAKSDRKEKVLPFTEHHSFHFPMMILLLTPTLTLYMHLGLEHPCCPQC